MWTNKEVLKNDEMTFASLPKIFEDIFFGNLSQEFTDLLCQIIFDSKDIENNEDNSRTLRNCLIVLFDLIQKDPRRKNKEKLLLHYFPAERNEKKETEQSYDIFDMDRLRSRYSVLYAKRNLSLNELYQFFYLTVCFPILHDNLNSALLQKSNMLFQISRIAYNATKDWLKEEGVAGTPIFQILTPYIEREEMEHYESRNRLSADSPLIQEQRTDKDKSFSEFNAYAKVLNEITLLLQDLLGKGEDPHGPNVNCLMDELDINISRMSGCLSRLSPCGFEELIWEYCDLCHKLAFYKHQMKVKSSVSKENKKPIITAKPKAKIARKREDLLPRRASIIVNNTDGAKSSGTKRRLSIYESHLIEPFHATKQMNSIIDSSIMPCSGVKVDTFMEMIEQLEANKAQVLTLFSNTEDIYQGHTMDKAKFSNVFKNDIFSQRKKQRIGSIVKLKILNQTKDAKNGKGDNEAVIMELVSNAKRRENKFRFMDKKIEELNEISLENEEDIRHTEEDDPPVSILGRMYRFASPAFDKGSLSKIKASDKQSMRGAKTDIKITTPRFNRGYKATSARKISFTKLQKSKSRSHQELKDASFSSSASSNKNDISIESNTFKQNLPEATEMEPNILEDSGPLFDMKKLVSFNKPAFSNAKNNDRLPNFVLVGERSPDFQYPTGVIEVDQQTEQDSCTYETVREDNGSSELKASSMQYSHGSFLNEEGTINSIWKKRTRIHKKKTLVQLLDQDKNSYDQPFEIIDLNYKIRGFNPDMKNIPIITVSSNFRFGYNKLYLLNEPGKLSRRGTRNSQSMYQKENELCLSVSLKISNISNYEINYLAMRIENNDNINCMFLESKKGRRTFTTKSIFFKEIEQDRNENILLVVELMKPLIEYPIISLDYNITQNSQPKKYSEFIRVPLFLQNFVQHVNIPSKVWFIQSWKTSKITFKSYVTSLFVAQHRLIKDHDALRINFPESIFIKVKQGCIFNQADLTRLHYVTKKYGIEIVINGIGIIMSLHVDNSDTCFIEAYCKGDDQEFVQNILKEYIYLLSD